MHENAPSILILIGLVLLGGNSLKAQQAAEDYLNNIRDLPAQKQFELLKERVDRMNPQDDGYDLLQDAAVAAYMQAGIDSATERLEKLLEQPRAGRAPENPIHRWKFRSYLRLGGEPQFSLHNPWDEVSFWAGLGESRHGVEIVDFEIESMSLHIRQGKENLKLPLEASSASAASSEAPIESGTWGDEVRQARPRLQAKWEEAIEDLPKLNEAREELLALGQELAERRKARGLIITSSAPDQRGKVAREELRVTDEMERDLGLLRHYIHQQLTQHSAFADENSTMVSSFISYPEP